MYPLSKVEEGYYGIQVNRYTFIFASEKSGICILCECYHFQSKNIFLMKVRSSILYNICYYDKNKLVL